MVSKDYSADSVLFQMLEKNLIMIYIYSTRTQINTCICMVIWLWELLVCYVIVE